MTLVLILLLLIGSAFGQQQAPTQKPEPLTDDQWVEQVLYPATVLLYGTDVQGNMEFVCTATAFDKQTGLISDTYRFVTASHCVSKDTDGHSKIDRTIFFITSDTDQDKKFIKVKVVTAGVQGNGDDFAVLEVKTRDKFPVVPLGTDPTSKAGEPIVDVNGALGLGKQVSVGRITNPKLDRPVEQGDISWTGNIVMQIQAGPGASGSAVVCMKQRAICGFLVGTVYGVETARPVNRFKEFYGSTAPQH